MTTYVDENKLERYLPHLLSPVYRLIEDDTVKDAQMSMPFLNLVLPFF